MQTESPLTSDFLIVSKIHLSTRRIVMSKGNRIFFSQRRNVPFIISHLFEQEKSQSVINTREKFVFLFIYFFYFFILFICLFFFFLSVAMSHLLFHIYLNKEKVSR